VAVSPPPNTVIPIGLGEIRLNEQIVSGDASSSAITVNAVHVVFNTAALMGDIIIAQSHCDVADDGTGVPVGAIGGLALSALLGAGFLAWTLIHRHRAAQA
jgi:hypothetical protein